MEGGIFLYTKQIASSELLLEALDGFNGLFIGGVEALGSRRISNFETLIIIGVQRVQGVGVVTDDIEQICRLVGSEEQLFTENVLEQTDSLFQILIFLLRDRIPIDGDMLI